MPSTMNITTRSLALAILSLTACGPDGFGGGDWDADTGTDSSGESDSYVAGELWGPCPIHAGTGLPTLCYGTDLACVPADFAEANVCLPLHTCPDLGPFKSPEIGWGDACFPRCTSDMDCIYGMVCGSALADDGAMCAWPV